MCILISVVSILWCVAVSQAAILESPQPFSEAPAPQPFQSVQYYADPSDLNFSEDYRRRSEDTYQRQQRQRQTLQDALAPWTPDPQVDYMRRRDAMRQRSIDGCTSH